jgi:uncharacterized membrane-anchored protein
VGQAIFRRFLLPVTASKVPEIGLMFWVVKVLTTAMGESTSDTLVHRFGGPVAVLMGLTGFIVAMVIQYVMRRYWALAYWLAVSMVGVFGTMAADVLHVGLGVPYVFSSLLYVVALAATFSSWYFTERTLSIHSITNRRRETFYWSAVFFTFATGTALGDFSAVSLHLGYAGSTALFAVAFCVPGIYFAITRAHPVLCFWSAYVLTRPLGASVADWLGKPRVQGGVGEGSGVVALVSAAIIISLVAYLALVDRDEVSDPARP